MIKTYICHLDIYMLEERIDGTKQIPSIINENFKRLNPWLKNN